MSSPARFAISPPGRCSRRLRARRCWWSEPGGFHGLLIGSVSQHCLRHASCPVAVVHRSEGAAPTGAEAGRIVVGIDGSAAARRALEWALDEARARTAALDVVYAWHLPHEARVPVATLGMEPDLLEDAARVTLDEAVDGQDTGGLSSPLNRVLAYGRPTPSILERSDGADLVVVGHEVGVGSAACFWDR